MRKGRGEGGRKEEKARERDRTSSLSSTSAPAAMSVHTSSNSPRSAADVSSPWGGIVVKEPFDHSGRHKAAGSRSAEGRERRAGRRCTPRRASSSYSSRRAGKQANQGRASPILRDDRPHPETKQELSKRLRHTRAPRKSERSSQAADLSTPSLTLSTEDSATGPVRWPK